MANEPPSDDHLPVRYGSQGATDDGGGTGLDPSITRRRFLMLTAGAAAVSSASVMSRGQLIRLARRAAAFQPAEALPMALGRDIFIQAERDRDLLTLDFAFYGFTVRPGAPPAIVPTTDDNHIVVGFPPQAIGEAVYSIENAGQLQVDEPPILSDLAGPSRLVFGLATDQAIPLPTMTVSDLLDWSQWALRVVPAAETSYIDRPDVPIDVRAPGFFETQIECPYALYLSPTDGAKFDTRREPLEAPVAAGGNLLTDCWAAVLTRDARVVASYARDYPGSPIADATRPYFLDLTPPPPPPPK